MLQDSLDMSSGIHGDREEEGSFQGLESNSSQTELLDGGGSYMAMQVHDPEVHI